MCKAGASGESASLPVLRHDLPGLGETRGFDPRTVPLGAWLALLYLVVAGSIAAFSAYIWLLHHDSPTRVGTYAYVNPVVAVLLGYFAAGEPLGPRTVAGMTCVLLSVLIITTMRRPPELADLKHEEHHARTR